MIHVATDFVEDLPEMRSILDGLQYRKRGSLKRILTRHGTPSRTTWGRNWGRWPNNMLGTI